MAYSDYGGYAYRNGRRVEARSDCAICSDGMMSSPGIWPGWAMMAKAAQENGDLEAARQKMLGCNMHHVLLGDGPIMVSLYKQLSISVWRGLDPLDLRKHTKHNVDGDQFNYLDIWDWSSEKGHVITNPDPIDIDGNTLTLKAEHADNNFSYVEWRQADGILWHGFSGYGVGAGLEDAGYGYSTEDCEDRLWELFRRPQEQAARGYGRHGARYSAGYLR